MRKNPDALLEDPERASLRGWAVHGSSADGTVAGALFRLSSNWSQLSGRTARIVVTFEDLHWADPLTWDLFDYLGRNLVDEHVVLVGTSRQSRSVHSETSAARRRDFAALGDAPDTARRTQSRRARHEDRSHHRGRPARRSCRRDPHPRPGEPVLHDRARRRASRWAVHSGRTVRSHHIRARCTGRHWPNCRRCDRRGRPRHSTRALVRVTDLDSNTLERALRVAIDAQLVVVDREQRRLQTSACTYRRSPVRRAPSSRTRATPSTRRRHARRPDERRATSRRPRQRACLPPRSSGRSRRNVHRAVVSSRRHGARRPRDRVQPPRARRSSSGTSRAAADGEDRGDRLWQAAELASGAVATRQPRASLNKRFDAASRRAAGHGDTNDSAATCGALVTSSRPRPNFEGSGAPRRRQRRTTQPRFAGLAQAELMLGQYDAAETRAQHVFELLGAPDADPAASAMAEEFSASSSIMGATQIEASLCAARQSRSRPTPRRNCSQCSDLGVCFSTPVAIKTP